MLEIFQSIPSNFSPRCFSKACSYLFLAAIYWFLASDNTHIFCRFSKTNGSIEKHLGAKLCGHYCHKCLKLHGNHALRCGAEFPVNFRPTVLSVIQCLLVMKNHFFDARMVFEPFWINASALSRSEPDLLSTSRDPRFQTLKLSTFLTCLASSRHRNRIYEGVQSKSRI